MENLTQEEVCALRQEAESYYKKAQVPQRLEEILNTILFEQPNDIYGRLSRYFETLSTPAYISDVTAKRIMDGAGRPSLRCDVFCDVRDEKRHMSSASLLPSLEHSLLYSPVPDPEEKKVTESDIVTSSLTLLHEKLATKMKALPIADQKSIDGALTEWIDQEETIFKVDEPAPIKEEEETRTPTPSSGRKKKPPSGKGKGKVPDKPTIPFQPYQKRLQGCSVVGLVSVAALKAGAASLEKPVFRHLRDLTCSDGAPCLPEPAVDVLSGGKLGPGKLNIAKTVFLIGKPGKKTKKNVETLLSVFHHVGKMMKDATTGVSVGYQPPHEKVEQPLDLINDAATAAGFTAVQDFYVGIDCAAHDLFDYDKGKYEIAAGTLKSADEMVEYYRDILTRYPSLIALINPLRKEDIEQWQRLCEDLSGKCLFLGDHALYDSLHAVTADTFQIKPSSGYVSTLGGRVTISDMISARRHAQAQNRIAVLSMPAGDMGDIVFSDVAVGVGFDIVRFGAPCHGETTARLNRLVEIERYLEEHGAECEYRKEFEFPTVKAEPTVAAAEGDAASTVAPSTDQQSKKS